MTRIKAVKCLETGVAYSSIRAAAIDLGLHCASIWQCCQGNQGTAGGLHWSYVDHPVWSHTISIKRTGKGWGVYYKDTLLKTFRCREFAEVYASDSALVDGKERRLQSSVKSNQHFKLVKEG